MGQKANNGNGLVNLVIRIAIFLVNWIKSVWWFGNGLIPLKQQVFKK